MASETTHVEDPLPAPVPLVAFLEQPQRTQQLGGAAAPPQQQQQQQQAPAAAAAAAGGVRNPTPPPSPPPAAAARSTPPPAAAGVGAGGSQQQLGGAVKAAPERPVRAGSVGATADLGPGGMSRLDYETAVVMHGMLAKYKEADPFRQPVDVDALNIPDYIQVIKNPMDLKTVRNKLRAGEYKNLQEWRADIQLIWDNARQYNGEQHPVTIQAIKLQGQVEKRMEDAVAIARDNLAAEARGEPRPRKTGKLGGRSNTELNALLGGSNAGSDDYDSMDERGSSPLLPSKVSVKRERDVAAADSNAGRAAKRRAGAPGPAGAAAAGGLLANQGLDLDALAALLNTPLARQLGAEEPDDIAFLALWKRLMTRKQQMAAAAGESEPLRVSNQQLRASLAAAQDSLRQLTDRFNEEKQGREAAVAAKEHAEKLLLEAQKEATHWQNEHSHQKKIMETQRDLLEQQQAVLRKLAAQKHTAPPATPAASAATAPAPAAAAAPAAPAASAAPADATAAAAPPSAQPNNA